jgi:hypothetical protein
VEFGRERAIWLRLAAAGQADALDRDALANCETKLAAALVATGRLAEARAGCDRAIAIREDLVKGDPANADFAQGLAESVLRSGTARAAAGDASGAAADWHRAASLYAAHPPVVEAAIFRACCHGGLAGLAGKGGSGIAAAEAASQAEEAMVILRGAFADGYRDIDTLRVEPGLDPLRPRDDFRRLMMDLSFPVEPFASHMDEEFRPVPTVQ